MKQKIYNYFFDKEISVDTINELVDKLQDREGKINLYFSTDGGSPDAMSFLIEYINTREEEIEITIIDWLMSAGTLLLTDFKGKIKLHPGLDFILFHLFDRESYSLRKSDVSKDILTKQDFRKNQIFAEKLKDRGILNSKQIKKFLKGENVVIFQDEFRKWKL
jgi:hypothetical protein